MQSTASLITDAEFSMERTAEKCAQLPELEGSRESGQDRKVPQVRKGGTGAQGGQADRRKEERAVPQSRQAAPKPPVVRRCEPLSAHWPGEPPLACNLRRGHRLAGRLLCPARAPRLARSGCERTDEWTAGPDFRGSYGAEDFPRGRTAGNSCREAGKAEVVPPKAQDLTLPSSRSTQPRGPSPGTQRKPGTGALIGTRTSGLPREGSGQDSGGTARGLQLGQLHDSPWTTCC